MFELIFKQNGDAKNLQHFFEKESCDTMIHETLFQNQMHYIVSIKKQENKQIILDGLFRFIMDIKRLEWAAYILSEYYLYKDPHEQEQILTIIGEMLSGERDELTCLLAEWDETGFVMNNLVSLMESEEPVHFDSFVKFRLKALYERMILYVEKAIDEYKLEQDYQMFVQMLRDYLASKIDQQETIHLYFSSCDLLFFNSELKEMKRNELFRVVDKRLLTNHPVYVDSYTIAPLLSMAPKMINVYCAEPELKLIRTIQNIFEERVRILPLSAFPGSIHSDIPDAANE
ncbi:sporulation protein YtxC [Bacillus sp. SG-1]|uniref:sporulation protein YtxC n=1 Tax=Bacillus sp. SG-1 TaxID=161544 RepID=UPI0005C61DC3|nr:sporulation protein YtxC [Bacillus sp. SG-1]